MIKILQKTNIDWKKQNIIIETWLKENYVPAADSRITIYDLLDDFSSKTQLKLQGKNALIAQIIKTAHSIWPEAKIVLKISSPKYVPNSVPTIAKIIGLKEK